VGETCGNHLWELEGQGDWLHTGAKQGSFKNVEGHNTRRSMLDFYFRDKRKAALFLVRWHGYL
jgi:hypothetical protein